MQFQLNYRDYGDRDVTQHGDGDYDYEWYETHYYHYENAVLVKDGYSDVALFPNEEEPKVGDKIYVAYAEYSTGDSFGHATGCRTHLWAFTNAENAHNFCQAILRDYERKPGYDYGNKPFMYGDVPVNTNEWKGYFERLTDCDYVTLEVRKQYEQ